MPKAWPYEENESLRFGIQMVSNTCQRHVPTRRMNLSGSNVLMRRRGLGSKPSYGLFSSFRLVAPHAADALCGVTSKSSVPDSNSTVNTA